MAPPHPAPFHLLLQPISPAHTAPTRHAGWCKLHMPAVPEGLTAPKTRRASIATAFSQWLGTDASHAGTRMEQRLDDLVEYRTWKSWSWGLGEQVFHTEKTFRCEHTYCHDTARQDQVVLFTCTRLVGGQVGTLTGFVLRAMPSVSWCRLTFLVLGSTTCNAKIEPLARATKERHMQELCLYRAPLLYAVHSSE